jgi:hypothetical protein
MMKNLYLISCFRRSKAFFALLLLFIIMIAYGHKTNLPVTPAFISNMYILKGDSKKDSSLFITINGRTLLNLSHAYDEPRRMLIYSTLDAYHQGILHGKTDPQEPSIDRTVSKHPFLRGLRAAICCQKADYDHYLPWLLQYMQSAVSDSIKRLDIGMSYIHYDDRNLPVADSTKHLYQIE